MAITEIEFQNWKEDAVTQGLMRAMRKTREELKENLIRGAYENSEFVQGKALCLQELLEMKYEDFMEALRND